MSKNNLFKDTKSEIKAPINSSNNFAETRPNQKIKIEEKNENKNENVNEKDYKQNNYISLIIYYMTIYVS